MKSSRTSDNTRVTFFDTCVKNVTIERLKNDEAKIPSSVKKIDFISYPEFLKYFSDISTITKHNVIIGINFTYGWMPTIFNFRSENFDDVVHILNKVKSGNVPTENELELLKGCFNNSLVGTSKLLHFINPEKFAIWDSRVYRYITSEEPYDYRINNISSFIDYQKFCQHIISDSSFNDIHMSLKRKIAPSMTGCRSLELLMYLTEINYN